jgi:hypothetical protein
MADNDNIGAGNTGGGNASGQAESGQQGGGQQPGAGNTSNGGGQQPQPTEKTYSFKEDRSSWVPPHRLSETTAARTRAEQERDALKQRYEEAQARIQALAGVTPKNPQDVEAEEIKGIIAKMFPKIGLLDKLDEAALERVLQAAEVAEKSSSAAWDRHTNGILTSLDVAAAKVLGVGKLDDKQSARIRRAFRDEANAAEQVRAQQVRRGERESMDTTQQDNDFIARFERGDAELVQEFAQDFLNGFIEPVRRSVTADVTRRGMRPVPRGDRGRNPIVQGQQQQDLSTEDGFKKAILAARARGSQE